MAKYIVTLEIVSEDGDPRDWDYHHLLNIDFDKGEELCVLSKEKI